MNDYSQFLASLVCFTRRKHIVEIGVAFGATTRCLCQAAVATEGHVYGFDIWDVHGLNKQFQAAGSLEYVAEELTKAGLTNFTLTKVDTKSPEFPELLKKTCPLIDFAFIDGCHSYEGIKKDFEAVYPLLSNDGIIAFHDTLKIDGCRLFMLALRKSMDGTYDIVDFPYGHDIRRVGVSLLVKRTYPILNINIDEVCGAPFTPEVIEKMEKEWYENAN